MNRVPLCQLPTPCHRLDRASETLGIDLWIKRDDLTGFAFGGNKGRKLEYLLGEAIAANAQAVVTCGAAQSNFIRQLGAGCSMLGLRCVAAIMNLPYAAIHGRPLEAGRPVLRTGNVWEVLYAHADALADQLESQGLNVYRIPIGGSSGVGAFAFVEAAKEVGNGFDWVITPCSSGSTHAGLAYGFAGSKTKVIGLACDPEPEIMEDLVRLLDELDLVTGQSKKLAESDLEFRLEWAGSAYGVPSEESEAALTWLARTEGIFLDPVYTAKAFAGVLELARSKQISGKVLFWHTGGLPALFAN
jgi:1-aminocyclopropane-1-carboxylate deaminase/D-cysteine desulfhydrase-like pyridoxal-dependent ACC family enzyme